MRNPLQGEGFPYYLGTGILFLLLLFGLIAPINKAHDLQKPITKKAVIAKKPKGKTMLYYGYHLTGPVDISGDYIENGIVSGVMSYYNSVKDRYLFYQGSSTGNWIIHDTIVGGAGQYQSPYGAYYNNMPLTDWVDYGFDPAGITLVGFSLDEVPAPVISGLGRLSGFNTPEIVIYGGAGSPE